MVDVHCIQNQYRSIRDRVACAAARSGREAASVTLIAVAKTFSSEAVRALLPLGPVIIGENRVQEAAEKMTAIGPDPRITWHLIGHLQSNKANRASQLFSMIHSVDNADLLLRLERQCALLKKKLPVLVEVNVGQEISKHGCPAATLPRLLEEAAALSWVQVQGLMAIPPWDADPEITRPYFREMARLRIRMAEAFSGALLLNVLSMGMSHDFEVAIEEGATHVRVGTAIFGTRPPL